MKFTVNQKVVTTVRELSQEPGTPYITCRTFRLHGDLGSDYIRVSTADPFTSLTTFGTRMRSFPSDKVHPVKLHSDTPLIFTR